MTFQLIQGEKSKDPGFDLEKSMRRALEFADKTEDLRKSFNCCKKLLDTYSAFLFAQKQIGESAESWEQYITNMNSQRNLDYYVTVLEESRRYNIDKSNPQLAIYAYSDRPLIDNVMLLRKENWKGKFGGHVGYADKAEIVNVESRFRENGIVSRKVSFSNARKLNDNELHDFGWAMRTYKFQNMPEDYQKFIGSLCAGIDQNSLDIKDLSVCNPYQQTFFNTI